MAALSGAQVDVVLEEGVGVFRVALYRLQKVTTNDTLEVSERFSKVLAAAFIGVTAQVAVFSLPVSANTTLTLNPLGLAGDACYVLVVGASAP